MEPPITTICDLSFPRPSVLLVTLNRPSKMNCIPSFGHKELDDIWHWMDLNPNLSIGIITGSGRAFCGGADLNEWINSPVQEQGLLPPSGFGGISSRAGKKPIIAAVNGLCVGGGTEMMINCDLAVASEDAKLSLPEVKVGLTELGGALPRLVRAIGKQRATLMSLTGRPVSAQQALDWGLVCSISKDPVAEALNIAMEILANSPDAIIATRDGLLMGWNGNGVDEAGQQFVDKWRARLLDGDNSKEGVRAFLGRRQPVWARSKL